MIRIDHGWEPRISPDGQHVAHGYEQLYVLNPRTGERRMCPHAGVQYLVGWKSNQLVGFMSNFIIFTWDINTNVITPLTEALTDLARDGAFFVRGQLMTYHSDRRLNRDGAKVILPEEIDGPVAGDPFYAYITFPNYANVVVRGSDDVELIRYGAALVHAYPHSLGGFAWLSGATPDHSTAVVVASTGTSKSLAGEGRGPVVRLPDGSAMIFTCFWHEEIPYVIGRVWDEWTAEGKGFLLKNFGHQKLDARTCADGVLVAAWKEDASAETQIELIPFDQVRVSKPKTIIVVPPTPIDPPLPPPKDPDPPKVDPPKVDPPRTDPDPPKPTTPQMPSREQKFLDFLRAIARALKRKK
jgi:hypothetical protein